LDTNSIGNQYDSPGIILQIPSLNEEEWDDDPSIRFYDNARDNLVNKYDQYVAEALNRSSLENEE
jgi:CRISPR/Cas system endoribonuclease Cas6 (RAMP superfamily)